MGEKERYKIIITCDPSSDGNGGSAVFWSLLWNSESFWWIEENVGLCSDESSRMHIAQEAFIISGCLKNWVRVTVVGASHLLGLFWAWKWKISSQYLWLCARVVRRIKTLPLSKKGESSYLWFIYWIHGFKFFKISEAWKDFHLWKFLFHSLSPFFPSWIILVEIGMHDHQFIYIYFC